MLHIKNGKVLTLENQKEIYEDLDIIIEDKKIVYIGLPKELKDGYALIDAKGMIITPGLIDAHTHLGMWEDAIGFAGSDGNEGSNPVTPELRSIDAINPLDRTFEDARSGGVTCVGTGPGSGNCMGGTFSVIKTVGKRIDDMIVKDPLAMKIAFGENPKRFYGENGKAPYTRMAISAQIREMLYKAKEYANDKDRKYDQKLEALLPVINKEIPLKAHAHRTDDIFSAIRIAKELDLNLTLEHVTEGHLISDHLAKEGYACVVGPTFGDRPKFELKNKDFVTAGELQRKGVLVSIMTDHPVIPIESLNMCAQLCVKEGMDRYEAIKAITINSAKIMEIDDKVGSLKVGKDADIVIWDGDILNIDSNVILTIIDGKVVYKK